MTDRDSAIEHILAYLASQISLDALEDWSAEASIDIQNNPDEPAQNLVNATRALLNRHEDDESPSALKQALLAVVVETVIGAPSSSSQIAELCADRAATEELRAAA
jgi:hypothetical protein